MNNATDPDENSPHAPVPASGLNTHDTPAPASAPDDIPEEYAPTRVMMFTLAGDTPGERTPIAEFTYHPDDGVQLIELDRRWSRIAVRLLDRGTPSRRFRRQIRPADGPAFMRALLEPTRTSYFGFIDTSSD